MDAIDCMVANNDLAFENDANKRDDNRKSKSRRDQRPYDNSNGRPVRRSSPPLPSSMNRKRPSSPVSSLRSRNHHASVQKHHRNSSPSPPPPPPPPPPSSRHHQSTRPITSTKRSYSPADSSRDRRQSTHRSRTDFPSDNILASNLNIEQTKFLYKQEKNDLSLISEDESSKKPDIKNSTAIIQSSPIPINLNSQSTTNLNETFPDVNIQPIECDISLFATSTLSNPNTSSMNTSTNSFMQTLDIINKFKAIAGTTTNNYNPLIELWLKEIPAIIQRQIDLQKIELDVREREVKLRERELVEKEKSFKKISSDNSTTIEPIQITIPDDKIQTKSSNNINHDIVNISPDESVVKTIPLVNENSNSTTITRKNPGKTRFSPLEIEPLGSSNDKSLVEFQLIEFDNNQISKKSLTPTILSPNEPILPQYPNEFKVTSSSTSRKVEIQTGNHEPTTTPTTTTTTTTKPSTQDLRLTLIKNRPKYPLNDDNEQPVEISPNSDGKPSNHDYQSQRSITSTSIESNIDDQRDVRRQRQQQYPYNSHRSYNSGSSSKYQSKQKRGGDNSDLRARIFEQKIPKSSRSTYKNNH